MGLGSLKLVNCARKMVHGVRHCLWSVLRDLYPVREIKFLSTPNRNVREIERRVSNSWQNFWSLKVIMKSDTPIKMKQKVLYPAIITYASQTWKLTHHSKNKTRSCQRPWTVLSRGCKRGWNKLNNTVHWLK